MADKNAWLLKLKKEGAVSPRQSLAEEAADNLREFILLEKLAPGTPIPERDISAALGISRTPLREAMRLLVVEGLIEYSSTRRPKVADPSLEEIIQYIKVLAALEALGGGIACVEASFVEINDILALNELMASNKITDPLEFFRLDMQFHTLIVEASKNEPLIETHRQYNARLWRARFISSRRTKGRETTLNEHKAISEALIKRNVAGMENAMRAHLYTTIENISEAKTKENNHET